MWTPKNLELGTAGAIVWIIESGAPQLTLRAKMAVESAIVYLTAVSYLATTNMVRIFRNGSCKNAMYFCSSFNPAETELCSCTDLKPCENACSYAPVKTLGVALRSLDWYCNLRCSDALVAVGRLQNLLLWPESWIEWKHWSWFTHIAAVLRQVVANGYIVF